MSLFINKNFYNVCFQGHSANYYSPLNHFRSFQGDICFNKMNFGRSNYFSLFSYEYTIYYKTSKKPLNCEISNNDLATSYMNRYTHFVRILQIFFWKLITREFLANSPIEYNTEKSIKTFYFSVTTWNEAKL